MKDKSKRRVFYLLLGGASGILNGLFGGGGGMLAVPLLRQSGLEQQKANATSLGVILPLAAVTLGAQIYEKGVPDWSYGFLLLAALPGSLLGALLLPKMKAAWLRRLFGGLLTAAALRLLFFS